MGYDTYEDGHIKNGDYIIICLFYHQLNLFLKEVYKENKKPNKI